MLSPPPRTLSFALALGVLAVSTAAPFIRLANAAAGQPGLGFSLLLGAVRLGVATLFLLPSWRRVDRPPWPSILLAGSLLALHFGSFIASLNYTSIAASTALSSTSPLWSSLLLWLLRGKVPSPRALGGISMALVGGFLIALAQPSASGPLPWLGNLLALLDALSIAIYFDLSQRLQQRGVALGPYLVMAYGSGALLLAPWPWLLGAPYLGYPAPTYLWMLLLALIPQCVGHTAFNYVARWQGPLRVTLATLLEPVGASLLGYVVLKEIPGFHVLIGGTFLLFGVALALPDSASR